MRDPRPLTTEPLALDLVNTRWIGAAGPEDLLADLPGLRTWLGAAGFPAAPADPAALDALRTARDAIRATALEPADPGARAAVNAVLARARVRELLGPGGPEREIEVEDESWRVPWLAARDLVELLRAPDRVRVCAHPDCILHFYDASRSGRRQWCSMAACGNRAKAARHYERVRRAG